MISLTHSCPMIPFQATCREISDDVFRLHILANSDCASDQALKLRVRDRVLAYTEDWFRQAHSKQEAQSLLRDRLQEIADVAARAVRDNGYSYGVKAELTNMYFSTRRYDDYTLPAGKYDALRLTLGKGEGHNWWCVMFPSLCLTDLSDRDETAKEALSDGAYDVVKNEDTEYRFFIVEWWEKLRAMFA